MLPGGRLRALQVVMRACEQAVLKGVCIV